MKENQLGTAKSWYSPAMSHSQPCTTQEALTVLKRSPKGETWLFSAHFIQWDAAVRLKTLLGPQRAAVPAHSRDAGGEVEQDESLWLPLAALV